LILFIVNIMTDCSVSTVVVADTNVACNLCCCWLL